MEGKYNNLQQRKFVRAVKPSEKSHLKYKPRQKLCSVDVKNVKRKNNEEIQNVNKRSKYDNFVNNAKEVVEAKKFYCPSPKSPKNLANERLKKLKQSLLEDQKKDESCFTRPLETRQLQKNSFESTSPRFLDKKKVHNDNFKSDFPNILDKREVHKSSSRKSIELRKNDTNIKTVNHDKNNLKNVLRYSSKTSVQDRLKLKKVASVISATNLNKSLPSGSSTIKQEYYTPESINRTLPTITHHKNSNQERHKPIFNRSLESDVHQTITKQEIHNTKSVLNITSPKNAHQSILRRENNSQVSDLSRTLPSNVYQTITSGDSCSPQTTNISLPSNVFEKNADIRFSPFTNSTPVKSGNVSSYSQDVSEQTTNTADIFSSFKTCDKVINSFEEGSLNDSMVNNFNYSQSRDEDLSTDMDWSPINEDSIIENISEIRKELDYKEHTVSVLVDAGAERNRAASDGLYIVVDTNIFLSHLSFVSELKNTTFAGKGPTVILVPWMVIQELDFMKDGRSNKSLIGSSRKAINFINCCLTKKDPRLKGQNVMDASKQNIDSNNPDDGILFCCMQLLQQGKNVVLLSNDKNFRNKAMFNNILAYSKDEIVTNLNKSVIQDAECRDESSTENLSSHMDKLKMVLSRCLSRIIEAEMLNAYGDVWMKMAQVVPPLTVEEALRCLDKYWLAVFSFKLLKQCKQCIDEFRDYLKSVRRCDSVSKAAITKFVEYCLRLCIYLKNGFNEHKQLILETISLIQQCAKLDT